MTAVATPDAARLVFAAVAGLILLLVLIIKFKVHAMNPRAGPRTPSPPRGEGSCQL